MDNILKQCIGKTIVDIKQYDTLIQILFNDGSNIEIFTGHTNTIYTC